METKLKPYMIYSSPVGCQDCFLWGQGVDENGICDNCGGVSDFNQELIDLTVAWRNTTRLP